MYCNVRMPQSLKPLVKWSGGKRDELDVIKRHMPEGYSTIAEPFAGGASLLFHLNPPDEIATVLCDTHPDLVNLYRQIGDGHSDEIKRIVCSYDFSENGYYRVRDEIEPSSDIERAAQFFYLRKACYRGMLRYNARGKFNIPWGRYKKVSWDELDEPGYGDLLSRTEIIQGDFSQVFNRYQGEDTFMFLDPPYDTPFSTYGPAGSFTQDDHRRLHELFVATPAKCLMVISETPFIRELYSSYIVEEYEKKYRFRLHSNRVKPDNIDKKHLVIKNY